MNYFVGFNLGSTLTGIEKAMINRTNLFKKAGLPAKCVFIKWNRFLNNYYKKFINKDDIINMYDFFQEVENLNDTYHFDWISYWEDQCNYDIEYVPNTNDVRVYNNGIFIIYAHFFNSSHKNIDYINYFDKNRRKVKRELFDVRGFLSCTKLLTGKQNTVYESYHNANGEIVIEKYYHAQSDKDMLDLIVLNFDNKNHYFYQEEELVAYFIETLFQENDLFFSDKNLYTAPAFNLTSTNIPVVAVLHSTHVKDSNNVSTSNYKNVYKEIFNNLSRYQAIITSTNEQKLDVSDRVNSEIPVHNIPVGFTNPIKLVNNNINHNKIISVARYSPEKQLDHQLRLIKKLKNSFPNIELHMYGSGMEKVKLQNLIKEQNLGKHVFLRGFLPDLENEFNDAYLSIITSNMEGFSLALLESLAHGVPTISYNIKYGPKEMINNGENGYLIEKDDEDALYEKVKYLLDHPELQHEFSLNSIKVANQFSEDHLIKQWQSFLKTI
ncbi:glycosyltransferase [Staphylococcus sp. HL28]|uniref:glycosyltransferase n=1 Tax=Staphylococcus sp. HL28 TaxID=2897335 RepID=UPI001E28AC20|nr:glycosyltransferase [Staphylococcus sp. HL28]UGB05940.1 glycosyltransferase [Staphylococcus sp. HL28]